MATTSDNSLTDAFAPTQTAEQDPRKLRLQSLLGLGGLAGLANDTGSGSDNLSQQPLNGGAVSKPTSSNSLPPEADEPAPLSTEAVQRAPAAYSAQPLLNPFERAGAAASEAQRGEEGIQGGGTTPGLSTGQRNKALMDFFRPQPKEDTPSTSNGSSLSTAPGNSKAAQALSAGNTAFKTGKQLSSLFASGGFSIPGDASGAHGFSFDASGKAVRLPSGEGFSEFGRQMDPNIAGPEFNRQMDPALASGGGMLNESGGMTQSGFDTAAREGMAAGVEGAGGALSGVSDSLPYVGAGLGLLSSLMSGQNPGQALVGAGAGAALSAGLGPLSMFGSKGIGSMINAWFGGGQPSGYDLTRAGDALRMSERLPMALLGLAGAHTPEELTKVLQEQDFARNGTDPSVNQNWSEPELIDTLKNHPQDLNVMTNGYHLDEGNIDQQINTVAKLRALEMRGQVPGMDLRSLAEGAYKSASGPYWQSLQPQDVTTGSGDPSGYAESLSSASPWDQYIGLQGGMPSGWQRPNPAVGAVASTPEYQFYISHGVDPIQAKNLVYQQQQERLSGGGF